MSENSMDAIRNTARLLGLNPRAADRLAREAKREMHQQERAAKGNQTRTVLQGPATNQQMAITGPDGTTWQFPVCRASVDQRAHDINYRGATYYDGAAQQVLNIEFMVPDTLARKSHGFEVLEAIFRNGAPVTMNPDGGGAADYILQSIETYDEPAMCAMVARTEWVRVR